MLFRIVILYPAVYNLNIIITISWKTHTTTVSLTYIAMYVAIFYLSLLRITIVIDMNTGCCSIRRWISVTYLVFVYFAICDISICHINTATVCITSCRVFDEISKDLTIIQRTAINIYTTAIYSVRCLDFPAVVRYLAIPQCGILTDICTDTTICSSTVLNCKTVP